MYCFWFASHVEFTKYNFIFSKVISYTKKERLLLQHETTYLRVSRTLLFVLKSQYFPCTSSSSAWRVHDIIGLPFCTPTKIPNIQFQITTLYATLCVCMVCADRNTNSNAKTNTNTNAWMHLSGASVKCQMQETTTQSKWNSVVPTPTAISPASGAHTHEQAVSALTRPFEMRMELNRIAERSALSWAELNWLHLCVRVCVLRRCQGVNLNVNEFTLHCCTYSQMHHSVGSLW